MKLKLPSLPRRLRRRLVRTLILAPLLLVTTVLFLRWFLTPGPVPRTEISPGVFLEVQELNRPGRAVGKVMIAEIHWDTPGLEIVMRPFDEGLPEGKHYRLTSPSLEVVKEDYILLMNGTLFAPGGWLYNFPGVPVSSNETVISEGYCTHIHSQSRMFWWDKNGNGFLESKIPPPQEIVSGAVTGVGVHQPLAVNGELADMAFQSSTADALDCQSIIAMDPERRILWLYAYENSTVRYAAEAALSAGAKHVGRLDSGDSSMMIVGLQADHVLPLTGLRSKRWVAHYIAVRNDKS